MVTVGDKTKSIREQAGTKKNAPLAVLFSPSSEWYFRREWNGPKLKFSLKTNNSLYIFNFKGGIWPKNTNERLKCDQNETLEYSFDEPQILVQINTK
jgi:hypothetical protein